VLLIVVITFVNVAAALFFLTVKIHRNDSFRLSTVLPDFLSGFKGRNGKERKCPQYY